jgi:hypothetical protein
MAHSTELENPFDVLEIPRGSSVEEARVAYERLMRVWNPGRFLENPLLRRRAEERCASISGAFRKVEIGLRGDGVEPAQVPHTLLFGKVLVFTAVLSLMYLSIVVVLVAPKIHAEVQHALTGPESFYERVAREEAALLLKR